jgi:hypothetical protein
MIANSAWRCREAYARDNERLTYDANREEVNMLLEWIVIPLGRGRSISADEGSRRDL